MTDQRLRQLERRWRETGAVDDEAAFLMERVRVGDLTSERLELAAFCGHEGARRAAPQVSNPPQDPERLLEEVEGSWGKRVAVGVSVAAAQAALTSCSRSGHPEAAVPTYLVDAADAAFKCPCSMHAEAAWAAYKKFSGEFWRTADSLDIRLRSAQSAALACARAAASRHDAASKAVQEAVAAADIHGVHDEILRYLLAWALAPKSAT
ncbi:MAG: hypothetical protein KIT58_07910 [Planctomycetota bacterium]|nr:hypothetical protein [Planctomycetota bacterium]